MSKAIALHAAGGWSRVEINSFGDIQTACGGYVERLALNESTTLWCNEEGKLRGMTPNALAIMLTAHIGLMPDDLVVGPCIVTGLADEDSDGYADVPSWVEYRITGRGSG